jgi:hypothetical protein
MNHREFPCAVGLGVAASRSNHLPAAGLRESAMKRREL